jgi:hypothetical protein
VLRVAGAPRVRSARDSRSAQLLRPPDNLAQLRALQDENDRLREANATLAANCAVALAQFRRLQLEHEALVSELEALRNEIVVSQVVYKPLLAPGAVASAAGAQVGAAAAPPAAAHGEHLGGLGHGHALRHLAAPGMARLFGGSEEAEEKRRPGLSAHRRAHSSFASSFDNAWLLVDAMAEQSRGALAQVEPHMQELAALRAQPDFVASFACVHGDAAAGFLVVCSDYVVFIFAARAADARAFLPITFSLDHIAQIEVDAAPFPFLGRSPPAAVNVAGVAALDFVVRESDEAPDAQTQQQLQRQPQSASEDGASPRGRSATYRFWGFEHYQQVLVALQGPDGKISRARGAGRRASAAAAVSPRGVLETVAEAGGAVSPPLARSPRRAADASAAASGEEGAAGGAAAELPDGHAHPKLVAALAARVTAVLDAEPGADPAAGAPTAAAAAAAATAASSAPRSPTPERAISHVLMYTEEMLEVERQLRRRCVACSSRAPPPRRSLRAQTGRVLRLGARRARGGRVRRNAPGRRRRARSAPRVCDCGRLPQGGVPRALLAAQPPRVGSAHWVRSRARRALCAPCCALTRAPRSPRSRVVEQLDAFTDVVYTEQRPSLRGLVSARDFVDVRRWSQSKEGAILLAWRGILTYPGVEQSARLVRARNLTCGALFQPVLERHSAAGGAALHGASCLLVLLVQTEARGWVPQRAVDRALPAALVELVQALRAYLSRT